MKRVGVVASHPVQYQAPWYRALAERCRLEVLYCHRQDAAGQAAAGFGEGFEWDTPLLDGYSFRWLRNVAREPSVDRFSGCDTPEIRQALADGGFDACIVNGWYLKSYLQAFHACRRLGIPVLSRGDSQLGGPRSSLTRAAKYLPYRWLLSRIDGHLYVGAANRVYLEHYGVEPCRLFFVPHFVDTTWFNAESAAARRDGRAAALRTRLGLREGAEVALFAGKLIEKKRPADFVAGVSRLASAGRSVQGVLVGSGALEAELRALARSLDAPVVFAGFRNQSEMPSCYALADVLVLPSDGRETWGLVANEALACGVSVVLSAAVGSARDLADGDRAGFAYPCGDVPRLAETIAAALDARRRAPEATQDAISHTLERFSQERAVSGTLEALEAVAVMGRPARRSRAVEAGGRS